MLLAGLFFGRDACSYITTAVDRVQTTVKSSIPVEVEIERARKMIKNLEPEIRDNMHKIAKEEVEVAKMSRSLDEQEELLAKSKSEILRLNDDLTSGSSHFVYAGRTYSEDQVRSDLANRFAHYKTSADTTEKNRKILTVRQQKLDSAREKLEAMMAAKRQLEVEVEHLEARLEMVRVAQTTSDFNFDDSHLSRTKQLISDINTRLEVSERLMNSNVELYERIPLDEEEVSSENVSDDVAAYFAKDSGVEFASTK